MQIVLVAQSLPYAAEPQPGDPDEQHDPFLTETPATLLQRPGSLLWTVCHIGHVPSSRAAGNLTYAAPPAKA